MKKALKWIIPLWAILALASIPVLYGERSIELIEFIGMLIFAAILLVSMTILYTNED